MKKWMIWIGGVITVLGLIWALLPHTAHANMVKPLTGVSVSQVLASPHSVHRIEGLSAFVIGLFVAWLGIRK